MKNKKEYEQEVADLDIASMIDLAIVVLIVGVIVVFGGIFLEDMREDITDVKSLTCQVNTTAFNGTQACHNTKLELALNNTEIAFFKIPKRMVMLVTAVLFAIVIGVLVKYIWFGAGRGGTQGGGGI